jgi:hypothetical protein
MNKKNITGLIFLLSALFTSISFANRPAEFESPSDEAQAEQANPNMDDGRPAAAEDRAPEPEAQAVEETQSGDVLSMPVETQAKTVRQLDFPRRGMTEDKVQNELGRPLEIVPAIGTPPIGRWVYNDRIVYFEHSTVLHVVAK